MASLSHIPTFHPLFSDRLFSTDFSPIKLHHQHRIFSCSLKKPRASRKVKSNEELCNDIREFLSIVGLPQDHVPSLKELSQHGRQDLANVVRRRGYKVIKEFLESLTSTHPDMSNMDEGLTGMLEADHDSGNKLTGQNKKAADLAVDVSISNDVVMMENHSNGVELGTSFTFDLETHMAEGISFDSSLQEKGSKSTHNGTLRSVQNEKICLTDDVSLSKTVTKMESGISSMDVGGRKLDYDDQSGISQDASFYSSLQEKATKFIQNGHLDKIEDIGFGISSERSSEDSKYVELQNALEPEFGYASKGLNNLEAYSSEREENKSSSQLVEVPVEESTASRDGNLSTENCTTDGLDVEIQKEDQEADISCLKHQKELELTQLKQEIEKEKLALSALQTKAEEELNKAQRLISEKDAELHDAEESLSGLKEVEIQYCGDGEIVEVAGSFDGWHHSIKMDPVHSSSILDSAGHRKPRVWRTDLWLYPGLYEIKFIVDGQWKIDPQRESVVSGSIHNNILRVDR